MNKSMWRTLMAVAAGICLASGVANAAPVEVLRAPEGGIQPQAVVDERGTVHVVYYKGDAAGGDVYYVKKQPGAGDFSKPVRVNHQAGSAIAAGAIRGAQLAVGRNSRVHVVWNGGKGATKVTFLGKQQAPLLYTRLNDAGTEFEPERNMLGKTGNLDGGSAVAADLLGHVYVIWNGSDPGNKRGEAGRAIYVAQSDNDGTSFASEKPALTKSTGACACCGMRAFADREGALYVTFRAAEQAIERDELFLVSPRPGAPFQIALAHPWKVPTCPMSSTTLTPSQSGATAAWETDGQVFFTSIDRATARASDPVSPPRGPKRKHPVAVANSNGQTLLVWTEGTAWAKGGSVLWQIFDAAGRPTESKGRAEGLPVWGLATAYAKADGGFAIVY